MDFKGRNNYNFTLKLMSMGKVNCLILNKIKPVHYYSNKMVAYLFEKEAIKTSFLLCSEVGAFQTV